jgi:hypothetical protein
MTKSNYLYFIDMRRNRNYIENVMMTYNKNKRNCKGVNVDVKV